jgi:hypothetical protein
MITAIEIENFKGIREPVRIELKPITLLFGPNSAGKSTILQALHYAREVLERRNLNPDFTVAGGKFVDLGGFSNLVHQRDTSRSVILRFELDIRKRALFPNVEVFDSISAFAALPVLDLLTIALKTATIEIEIGYSEFHQSVSVRRYAVAIDGEFFAEIVHNPDQRSTVVRELNTEHPSLLRPRHLASVDATPNEIESLELTYDDIDRPVLDICLAYIRALLPFTGDGSWPLVDMDDAMPDFDRFLPLHSDPNQSTKPLEKRLDQEGVLEEVKIGLTQLIVGPGRILRDWLTEFCYLGPIRELPLRGYTTPRSPDSSRWASGLAAWDLLTTGPEELVNEVNGWLSDPGRLDTRYRVERRRYKRLDVADPLVHSLESGRAFDDADRTQMSLKNLPTETHVVLVSEDNKLPLLAPDVGIGISQILPVVVAAVGDHDRLVVIEQPELHVHPRIQAELGDLFIETAVGGPHTYLIETHSEHLILRILRRIRETSEGKPHNGVAITGADMAVYYACVKDDRTCLVRIDIDKKGEFVQPWPDDFFEIDFYERFGHAR